MGKKTYLIDLDGTMYWGKKIIPGAKKWIDFLVDNRESFYFLTNNSTRTQQMCCDRMLKMGFKGLKPQMFYTSAMAAAETIARMYPNKKRAGYLGEKGMREALVNHGFELVQTRADFVFVGLDREATYADYSYALRLLVEGAKLVGTNDDRILLSEQGANVGNGAVVALLEYASGQDAIRLGKPHPEILEGALRYIQEPKENVILVGDNLETDILAGNKAGMETILVTTGVHVMEDCTRLNIKPTYIVAQLSDLIR